jgi:hypothetical protein
LTLTAQWTGAAHTRRTLTQRDPDLAQRRSPPTGTNPKTGDTVKVIRVPDKDGYTTGLRIAVTPTDWQHHG